MDIILNSFGSAISCDSNCFVIKKSTGKERLPIDGIKSIQLSKGTQITSDAVMLAIENEIEVIFSDRSGKPIGRVWSPKYGSISTIRKGQIGFLASKDAVEWIKDIIVRKIENQQAMLLMMDSEKQSEVNLRNTAVQRLEKYIGKIKTINASNIHEIGAQIRGWEGIASKIYFEALNIFIPEKYRFQQRSQRPALDIYNALLNYGYGILYGKIEGALIKAGIDPYIGVLHKDEYNRPVLVYDIIEIYRIWIDYIVYNIISQDIMTDEFYSVRNDGACWLENLGRRVIIQSVNDYLHDTVEIKNYERTRQTQIQLYANNLAQTFKKYQNL